MRKILAAAAVMTLLAACNAEQLHRTAVSACRGSPASCTDPNQPPAARSPGM